ncbi:MAG: RHS repeat-associated core domain-containing protein [Polyangiaceae bacterium]|nr:RHS repeat-associated core domain-containing protein [Polyangiaceae bacterium]
MARLHGSRARKRGIQGRNAQQQTLYEEYAPYGTSAYRSAKSGVEVSARRYRYTGKERDDETGLYYYGARYYAAWLGRWTSADPLGIGADGPGVYNYVRGSPVVYSDPSGMESWSEETVQRHADRRPPPRPAQEPKAEPEVPDDLTTGQTIDPRIDVGVPDAVPPELAFANEIRANIGALLAAERAAALTGEGGASAGLAEPRSTGPLRRCQRQLGAAERDRPDDRRRARLLADPGWCVPRGAHPCRPGSRGRGAHPGERRVPRRPELRARHHGRLARHARRLPGARPRHRRGR